jgi:hypothetical protein
MPVSQVCKLMEGTVKVRLLLTSALLMFVQIPAPQAQGTVDVAKITCEDYFTDKITFSQYVVMWLSGYYNGKRNNTIIDPDAAKKKGGKLTYIATNTVKRPSWKPSRTCSALTNGRAVGL